VSDKLAVRSRVFYMGLKLFAINAKILKNIMRIMIMILVVDIVVTNGHFVRHITLFASVSIFRLCQVFTSKADET